MNTGDSAGLTIFVGRFGSGKTEIALNYALALARDRRNRSDPAQPDPGRPSRPVLLIDLDIVTPYFRSRETAAALGEQGVEVIAPSIVGQHLDTPAITPQIRGAIEQVERPVVLDVGGDRQGARALGQFSGAIRRRGYVMHFVVNPYRPFTQTVRGLADSISEIEAGARLRVDSLVSNPNLMDETTVEQLVEGAAQIEEFAQELGLPVAFVCVDQRWVGAPELERLARPTLALKRHFVTPW